MNKSQRVVWLTQQIEKIDSAIANVLEAGQEFETRDGRVKMANLTTLQEMRNGYATELAELQGEDSGFTDTVHLKFNGC